MKNTFFRFLSLFASIVAIASASLSYAQQRPTVSFDQGWSKETRDGFYFTPQGSRMAPFKWFMALETVDGEQLFSAPENLAKYGFIAADGAHDLNPGNLPIGFAIDPAEVPRAGRYVGLTCAACHTGNMTVDGSAMRIDGGASSIDFDNFYQALAASFARTVSDEWAFDRFADRVLKEKQTEPAKTDAARQTIDREKFDKDTEPLNPLAIPAKHDKEQLRVDLAEFCSRIAGDAAIRRPLVESGYGRVDAVTQIVNALSAVDQREPHNLRPVWAPTSYPHLWLTSELEFVQWNAIAASPIARNIGEVLGVFGSVTLTGDPADWYKSTALVDELARLENALAALQPPKWDSRLGGVNPELAAEGKVLYTAHCDSCHSAPPYRRTNADNNIAGRTFIAIKPIPYQEVGTDPVYIEALGQRIVRTNGATAKALNGRLVVRGSEFFLNTVGAVVHRALIDLNISRDEQIALHGFRFRRNGSHYEQSCHSCLKAGPLTGIWASGPYLHNGSVPTIYELLSPVSERRKVFWTGFRELDREKLGFLSDDAPGRFKFDTSIAGNSNAGHLYPPEGLQPGQKKAIIEYLKTL